MDATSESFAPEQRVHMPAVTPAASDQKPTGRTKISVEKLDFFYGSYKALHEISVEIPEKQITALIGPSGCGKSTFLRTLNRINDMVRHARFEGKVTLDGEDVRELDATNLRRRVGMVFQRPNPFPKTWPTASASTASRAAARCTNRSSKASAAPRCGTK